MTGQTISHFKVLDRLGEGGMGVVYRGQDLTLNRPVALKFVSPHLAASEENVQRLLREARAASSLNHPNVMTIYEVGEFEGRLFIAAEYIEGKTLRQVIRPGGVGVELTGRCARQIAGALGAAHAKGIVHRDIKPQNLMLTAEGRIKVLDFGLAFRAASEERLTRTGVVRGTLHYMSPEQLEGKPVDHRTDIFSLGVVLYEMVSGKHPFGADYDLAVLY